MPACRQSIKRQHPSSGVRLDFEKLLKTFTETETVRYEHFADIWRKMQFSMLCAGRQNDREVREFMDECFHIALSYYLPPYNFQVRVGGLYLIYGLYFTQMCFPKSKVRVTPVQWKQILEFQDDARSQQHLDVDFCFQKLLVRHAFHFVATAKQIYPRSRDPIENASSEMPDELKETEGSVQKMFSGSVLEELSAVHTQYEKIKIGLAGPDAERPVRSLDMIQSKLVDNIMSRLEAHNEKLTKLKQQIQQKKSVLELSDDEDPTFEPSESNMAKLKAKAFSGMAKQTRSLHHRVAASHESSCDTSPSKSLKEEVNNLSDDDGGDDDDDSDDYDAMVDSLIKMKPDEDFLPMPSLTTEKVDSPEKVASKTVKKLSRKQLKEQKKQRERLAKKDEKKARKKRVQSETETDSSLTPSKKKQKQSSAKLLPSENKSTQDSDNETDLPKIKAKQRKKKCQTVIDKSENVGEAVTDLNERGTNSDAFSPNKKKARPRKGQVKAKTTTNKETNMDTTSLDPAEEVSREENNPNASIAKKQTLKRKHKHKNEVVNTDENVEEAGSINYKNVDKKNSFEVSSDTDFSSPTRKRRQQKRKSSELLPEVCEDNSVTEKDVDPEAEVSSPRKSRRQSGKGIKVSDKSDEEKSTKKIKNDKSQKKSTPARKSVTPKTHPVPLEKKEKTPKISKQKKK